MLLKEVRELASFVLNFVDDNLVLMQNSGLSMSPTLTLGKERVSGIQLSSIFFVILITVYIKSLSAAPPKIDLLVFSAICVGYFALASFLVARVMKYSLDNSQAAAELARSDQFDFRLDSTSYVLFFNTIALFAFALTRDVLFFYLGREFLTAINVIAGFIAAILACGSILFLRVGASRMRSCLTRSQKLFVTVAMTITFLLYATILSVWH